MGELNKSICGDIAKFKGMGYKSIAVICKSEKEARLVKASLNDTVDIRLLEDENCESKNGLLVMEFDVVLVYNASKENYKSDFDKRLMYVACTRALHQLVLYYTGEKSEFIL